MSEPAATAATVTFADRSPAVMFDQPQLLITLNITDPGATPTNERMVFRSLVRFEHDGRIYNVFQGNSKQTRLVVAVDGDLMQFVFDLLLTQVLNLRDGSVGILVLMLQAAGA